MWRETSSPGARVSGEGPTSTVSAPARLQRIECSLPHIASAEPLLLAGKQDALAWHDFHSPWVTLPARLCRGSITDNTSARSGRGRRGRQYQLPRLHIRGAWRGRRRRHACLADWCGGLYAARDDTLCKITCLNAGMRISIPTAGHCLQQAYLQKKKRILKSICVILSTVLPCHQHNGTRHLRARSNSMRVTGMSILRTNAYTVLRFIMGLFSS